MDSTSEAQQDFLMVQPSTGPILFSSKIADSFLAQRWKEAIVANHVRLVLPFEVEVSDDYDTAENGHYEMMPEKPCASNGMEKGYDSFVGGRSCSTEKASRRAGSIEPSNSSKHKFKTKPEKDSKLKYVPKQTHNAMGE